MAHAPHPRPLDLALPFEAHIRLEPALLRRVFDVNPDGVLVIDDDGVVAAANPAAVALTGYPHERLVGLRVDELVQIEARQRHRDLRMDAQRERVERPMSASTTLTLARADGVLVPVEIALNAIDGSGDYMAVIRDVTERVKIKDRLELSEEVVLLARERERIARDLHDTVLQRLFGLGLELQAAGMRAEPATAERLGNAVDEIDLVIALDEPDTRLEGRIERSAFDLHCVPVVNLFEKTLDRVLVSERFSEFHVVPDRNRPLDFEIYQIVSVTGHGETSDQERAFVPFYRARDTDLESNAFYTLHRAPRLFSDRERLSGRRSSYAGTDAFVSIVDADMAPCAAPVRQLRGDFEELLTHRCIQSIPGPAPECRLTTRKQTGQDRYRDFL